MVCETCGADNREGARFCDTCGAALDAAPAREQRKVVTVLFCDVTGSTALGERLDPEAMRSVMASYFDTARLAIERHGGTVEKFIGDAVMAVFGVPTVREDDALRAVRAALELRDSVAIDVRIGVNTGEVVTGRGDTLVTGDAVNVAARLEQAASPGEVLIGDETLQLVRGAVDVEAVQPLEAKGKSEPVIAHRLIAVTGDVAVARRGDAPLVGRERERRLLADAWERACSERATALFTVLGNAGVGKSRLALEFLEGLDATVLRGRCLSYGDGITYWPVVEVVKQLLQDAPPPDQAIAALLGDGAAPADEIAFSVRKLFEAAAAERPLVVLFDDLQWAEPTFLDLIEHVVDWSREAPILLLCLARPDLLERRPGWGGGKVNATAVLLEQLSAEETDELIDRLLAGGELAESLRARVRDAADGNPLFVEQMLAMVDESGDGEVVVPPSIQALLAARLDQLPAAERATLERGAVEGQVFHRGAVVALAPDDPNVTSHLNGLVRKELVRPSTATLPGDDAFRFRHLLIRDAAYDALPKAARAELHERFAVWVEERVPDLVELDEIVGYHLEQAALFRAELGTPAPELAARAAERLGAAGQRAERREDARAALSLLRRAVALLPEESPERVGLLPDLGRALYVTGELDDAYRVLDEAVERGDADTAASARFFRAYVRGHASGGSFGELEREVREAIASLAGGGNDRTLAQGYLTLAWLLFWSGRIAEQVEAGQQGLVHARRAGDSSLEELLLRHLALGLAHGPARWTELERFATENRGQADRLGARLPSRMLVSLAAAAAHQGRLGEARTLAAEFRQGLEERGHTFALLSNVMVGAYIETLDGRPERAEAMLRASWDGLGELGERGFRSSIGVELAEALVALGRVDEALELLDEAEQMGSPDDWLNVAGAAEVRARAALARGEHERATDLAREAVEIADAYEYVDLRTELWLLYSDALVAAGQPVEARRALEETLRLAELKGSVVYGDPARALLMALPVPG